MALSEAIMKGQWPPQCLPPIMWSEEASSVSIEAAEVWLEDNTALLATGETNTNAISFSLSCLSLAILQLLQNKRFGLIEKQKLTKTLTGLLIKLKRRKG